MESHSTSIQNKSGINPYISTSLGSSEQSAVHSSLASRNNSSGFTLFETLIVLALMGIILAFSITVSFNSYKGYVFRVERNVLVSILERARSRAMNNYGGMPSGVCFVAPNYVLFRGSTCNPDAPNNELIPSNTMVHISGISTSSPVIFEQLTGKLAPRISPVTEERHITLTAEAHNALISINNEGRINW